MVIFWEGVVAGCKGLPGVPRLLSLGPSVFGYLLMVRFHPAPLMGPTPELVGQCPSALLSLRLNSHELRP